MTEQVTELDRQLGFWREQLAGLEPLELPTDRPRPPVRSVSGGSTVFTVTADVADGLREVAQREGVTMFEALLSVFQVLLAKYSGQDNVAVGTPIAGWNGRDIDGLTRFFVNTVVLRGDLSDDPTVGELFRRVRERVLDAYAHQDLPFERLVEELAPERDLSRNPLFQAWFALEHAAANVEAVEAAPEVSNCDLAMTVRERGAVLYVGLEYSTDLFDRATVERMAGHLQNLLAGVLADPQARLSKLEMLSAAERRQILVEWNDTAADYPQHLCVHQLVEQQAAISPDAVAVVFEDVSLSYRELNEQANQMAHHLRTVGVGPEVLVGICVERGPEMIVGLLGILKAGGAYVPMDPAYPAERLAFMVADTATPVVVTQASLADRLPADAARTLVRIDADRDAIAARPSTDPTPLAGPDNLAYVIYTSGSTGIPKGVQIEHQSLICRTWEMRQRYGLTSSDRVLQFASISFDSSVEQIFPALTVGASLVLRGKDFDPESVMTSIRRSGVTMMQAPPSVWGQLLRSSHTLQLAQTTLRKVILAGEAVPPGLLERWFEHSQAPIYNAYGPSETTVTATTAVICSPTSQVPIGRPIANTEVFVMDRYGRPVPVGVAGELWIGGAGVARGYLNRPELTAERFVPHPFSDDPAARVYRTGDVVRWLPDGNLEFIGRVDDQVKVRGFRIELGEVEAVLGSHETVGSCVVVAGEDPSGDKRLVAYVVPAAAEAPTTARLRSFLKDRLPDHMVPSAFVALKALPLTPNGKVDRKALPAPDGQRLDVGDEYVAPRNELEIATASIWMQVLGVDKVGVHDDFFRLGGDSIVAIQLLGRLRQRFGVHLPVQELLNRPTVERFCEFLGGQLAAQPSPVSDEGGEVDTVVGEAPLLPIQEWFFRSDFARPDHWNQAFMIATPELDMDRLRECVRELGNRHGAFRLRYRRDPAGEAVQYYENDYQPTDLVVGSVADIEDLQAQLTAWQADFDLAHGPVYRIGYLDGLADGSARVFVACHHLIVDAVSWRVIAEDLEALYHRRSLPPVGSTYRQWTMAVQQYASRHAEERDYWQQVQSGYEQTGAAALQRLVDSEATMTVSRLVLDQDTTKRLLHCHWAYHTQINDVLLAAFAHALMDLTGESVNHVILEGHGREEVDPGLDVGRTVGWFTTMFPVRLHTGADQLATLRETKETLREIPAKGIGYGTLYGYHDDRLPRINFNYLGRLDAETAEGDSGRWRLTREPFGEAEHAANHDNIIMRINGWIADGRFALTIANKLGQETGDRLVQRYEQCLVELIGELSAASRAYFTPSDIDHVVSQEYLEELQSEREIQGVHLANSLQQGFVYQNVTHGRDDDAYIVQMTWEYASRIDTDAMHEAWTRAQRVFPALRLRFGWREDVLQIIDAEATVDWRYVDLSDRSADEAAASIQRLRKADRTEPYNLGSGPLFRVYLVKQSPVHFSCIFSHHHSILDGWSNTVLVSRVHELYEALVAGLPTDTTPDRGYSSAQKYLQEHRKDHTQFWRDHLARYDERMDLEGLLRPHARADGLRVDATRRVQEMRELSFTVSGEQLAALRRLTQDSAVTVNALMLYVWHKILACYAGAKQTITGVVLSGRGIPVNDIDTSVGLFINTLPLIVLHEAGDEPVLDGIQAVQRGINELNAHSTVNLAELHEGADRLFDTLFIYENWPKISPDGWQSRLAVRMGADYEKLDYPLSVIVSEVPGTIQFRLVYAAELFDARYMTDMLDMQRHLLDEVLADKERPWREVELLSEAQHRELAVMLNPAAEPLTAVRETPALHEHFQEQARRTPGAIAVVSRGESLTYQALNERANRLARVLVDTHRVGAEELIVLCLNRRVELIVAMLAVMKAGGAYVPLDPGYPDERIAYILRDTSTRVVLTTSEHGERLAPLAQQTNATVRALDAADVVARLQRAHDADPVPGCDGSRLMYVLYTSGTTGLPKGVMIEHRSYGLLLDAVAARYLPAGKPLSTYSVTNQVFDIFGLEYGLPLLTGGSVELATELPETLDCTGLDFVQMTPSVCDLLLDRLTSTDRTVLLVGGESLSPDLLNRVLARSIDLVNVYGPTETTIWSTSRLYRHSVDRGCRTVGLGTPFDGESVHVLDDSLRPVPVGAIGELFVGGVGLARGYLNNAGLTAEKFVTVPVGTTADKPVRLYRTGDLVRLRSDGELEYFGRTDFQVKIRGHRVELGEVEAALAACPGVQQCVVVAKPMGSQFAALVGYVVSGEDLDSEALKSALRKSLPESMVPSALVRLDALPLTINGKLDRRALPDPATLSVRPHVPPRSEVDATVCRTIAGLLGRADGEVGIDDDFFELGGNSILSIKLIAALAREAGIATNVRHLLAHRTVREFVDNLGANVGGDLPIVAATGSGTGEHALSFAQERLWFIERFEGGTTAYNLPLILDLDDSVDDAVLARSVVDLLGRHETLRTVIRERADGVGYQVVVPPDPDAWHLEPVTVADLAAMHADIRGQLDQPFNLADECPTRVRLYHLERPRRRVLSLVIHHIAFDGWSTDVLLRDLAALYRRNSQMTAGGQPPTPPPPPAVTYRDYAAWQRAYLSDERIADLLTFWRDALDGAGDLDLVTDRPRPERKDYRGANLRVDVDADVSRHLRLLAQRLKVSLFSVLLSGYYMTLRGFSRQDDIVVGTPVANRDLPQVERLVGFFVNTLPVRSRLDPATPVEEYIRQTAAEVLDVLGHQELPFERLVDALNVTRDRSRHPIFQVVFGVQSFGAPATGPDPDPDGDAGSVLRVSPETDELYTAARFDFSTIVDDSGDRLRIGLNYATTLFDAATVDSFARTYLAVLGQFAALERVEPDREPLTIGQIGYLGDADVDRIVHGWGAVRAVYESDDLLHRMFERQAWRAPDSVALVCDGSRWTYRALNESANALAHHMIGNLGVAPGDLVVLCLDRGERMVAAILATLKAGAAYVPVDPSTPDSRIGFVLRDTGAKTILTNRSHAGRLAALVDRSPMPEIVAMDDDGPFDMEFARDPDVNVSSDSAAYVIYTSGTTGQPKGVPQTHANVVRLFAATDAMFGFDATDVWTLFHSYVFDFTVWELWGALLHGGRLVVPSFERTRDPELFHELCRDEQVTVLNQTPTAFYQFIDVATRATTQPLTSLRHVVLGGEALNVAMLKPWFDQYGYDRPRLVNMYGITETTVHVTHKPLQPSDEPHSLDLGRVLPDMRAYVLDERLRPLPAGAVGELFVGGAGLTPGYLNRPELTRERFIPNPFLAGGGRLYRTGDLVRWTPAGTLEYFGRNDHQVKIRGHRIELGEIEAAMSDVPGVRQCVAVARQHPADPNLSLLVGYYVSDREVAPADVEAHLRARIPEYMIPAALVPLHRLPLTINGKLDRDALPAPALANQDGFVAPRTALEARVREVLARVLNLQPASVSVTDNFFSLGGNSILSIKLASLINWELNATVSIATLFKHSSVAELTAHLEPGGEPPTAVDRLVAGDGSDHVLSYAQEGLWFIDRYEQGTSAYNVQLCYAVRPDADLALLERSIHAVVERHEVLRTVIEQDDNGEPRRRVLEPATADLRIRHVTVDDSADLDRAIRRESTFRFDLARECPFRATVYTVGDGRVRRTVVGFLIHHIAFDGWSAIVLRGDLREFYTYYATVASGRPARVNLPELTIQYRDYAAWQRRYLSGARLSALVDYWRTRLAGRAALRLPTDHPRPAQFDYRGAAIRFTIDPGISRALRALAKEHNVSLFSVLLAGYYLTLHTFTGQRDLVVGVPAFNRQHDQTQPLIGCFVNTLALDFRVDRADTVRALVAKVAARVAEAQEHEGLPFALLVNALGAARDPSSHPVCQVWFDFNSLGDGGTGESHGAAPLLRPYALDGVRPDGEPNLVTQFDLSIIVDDSMDALTGTLTYAVSLFDRAVADSVLTTYQTILGQLAELLGDRPDPYPRVSELESTTARDRQALIRMGRETDAERPLDAAVCELFRAQAARTPSAPAVVWDSGGLTYRQLDERSNRFGRYLADLCGVRPHDTVAVCVGRSVRTVVALLATWKAGGVFVAVPPEDTDEHMAQALADCAPRVVLCEEADRPRLARLTAALSGVAGVAIVALDSAPVRADIDACAMTRPLPSVRGADLAHIAYVPSDDGHLAGLMIEHRSIVDQAAVAHARYGLRADHGAERILALDEGAGLVAQVPLALLHGHTLVVPSEPAATGFAEFLVTHRVTHLAGWPTRYRQLDPGAASTVRRVVVDGDTVDPDTIERLAGVVDVFVEYGWAETTGPVIGHAGPASVATAGRPHPNSRVFVLDDDLRPVPVGAVGHVYVAGAGLARGYLHQPAITAKRFLPDPFQPHAENADAAQWPGGRLFRTGRLGRWRSNGTVEYVDRPDRPINGRISERIRLKRQKEVRI